jgi:dTDP-glucose pyrophosphorylase/predicted transcriptional regulator
MALSEHRRILVRADHSLRHTIGIIDTSRIQIALVVDKEGRLLGTVTDGDVRRGILRGVGLEEEVGKVMNRHPLTAPVGTPREELLALMTSRTIKQVPLLDNSGRVVGLELLDNLIGRPTLKENPVVILAGGQGTRLRPLTDHTPKPLLKVGDRPLLELILQQLRAYGFHRVFISINYLGNQIEKYFGDGRHHGVSIHYLREPEPLGTAGPLALVPGPLELPCIAINGDLLTKVSFEHLLAFHRENGFHLTIGVKEYPLQLPFGVVVTHEDRVVDFQEKPVETRLINAGVYVLEPEVVGLVPHGTYYDMNQLIERVIAQENGKVGAFPIHEYWMDIGTTADYLQAHQEYEVHFTP